MKPLEFVLWLNGATGMLGETPPTAEQWQQIRANLVDTIGPIVASKLLDRANDLAERDEVERLKLLQQKYQQYQQDIMAMMQRKILGNQSFLDAASLYGVAVSTGRNTLGR